MGRTSRHHRTAGHGLLSAGAAVAVVLSSLLGIQAQGPNQFDLFIHATDASGAPVTDLKPEEITMAESGMPGKVVSVERFNLPIKLTLIVDNGPDSDRVLEPMRAGLTGLVDALPPDLEVNLWTTAGQPRNVIKATTDRGEIKKGLSRFGRDGEDPRFSDSLVEYSRRLEKELKDKRTYSPALIMVSTIAGDATSYQLGDVERAMKVIAGAGTRVGVAITTSKLNDNQAIQDLTLGRQGQIGSLLVKASRGNFQTLPDARNLATLLPEWGKPLAATHIRQTTQFRVRLERPAGVSGPLNTQNLDLRVTRKDLKPTVSGDGRF
jgi:hypothetical protein